ncbi:hypothetical protein EMIT0P176_350032 [Pseudomonas sp. IT-P176]
MNQALRVIVDDHREQARSHRFDGYMQNLRAPQNHCGSEPARDGRKSTAVNQARRVIVDDHREQAASGHPLLQ